MKKHDNVKGILNNNGVTGDSLTYIAIDGGAKPSYVVYTSGSTNYIVNENSVAPSAIATYTGGTITTITGATTCLINLNFSLVYALSSSYAITQSNGELYLNGILMIPDQAYTIGFDTITYLGKTTIGYLVKVSNSLVLVSIAVTLSPTGGTAAATYLTGATVNATATGTYDDATTADLTTVATWASSSASIASVVPTTGVITTIISGSTSITATVGSIVGTKAVNVVFE